MAVFLALSSSVAVVYGRYINSNIPAKNIANMSGFYIALTAQIIGVQLFLAGFIAEMISRNAYDRNNYQVEKEV